VETSNATLPVLDYIAHAERQGEIDMISIVSDNMPEPFDLRTSKTECILSIPANIADYDRLLFRQIILLAKKIGVDVVGTTQTITVSKETEAEKNFFYGFFKLLTRFPLDNETFSFNADSVSAKGAAQCKLIILQKSLKGKYADVQQFLPKNLFTDKGARRIELEFSAIATGQKSNTSKLTQCVSKLVELWQVTDEGKRWFEFALTYKIPTPMILDGLHKTVTEKVKGKDVVKIKKPKRPSKRIEILSKLERNLIAEEEKPFIDYKEKMKSLGNEIPINLIKSTRDSLRELIQKMWAVVEKFSAPLTKRRTAMLAPLTEQERRKVIFNKAYVDRLRAENFQSVVLGDIANLYLLSPTQLLLKCDVKYAISTNRILIKKDFILIEDSIDEKVASLYRDYAAIVRLPVRTTMPQPKPARRRHTKEQEDWSDEDLEGVDYGNKSESITKETNSRTRKQD